LEALGDLQRQQEVDRGLEVQPTEPVRLAGTWFRYLGELSPVTDSGGTMAATVDRSRPQSNMCYGRSGDGHGGVDGMAGIFRQSALDRPASPERLDETISIVSLRSWLLLLGLALVIAAGILWGVFGSIPTRVYGQAIIVSEGSSTHALEPLFAGRIVEVPVARDTPVTRGQELVRLRIPSLEQELRAAAALPRPEQPRQRQRPRGHAAVR
jgi:hypothetical protein